MEAPPPMSFPAILRNPGLSGRFAHLQVNTSLPLPGVPTPAPVKKLKREHEGKRWIRRKENERFMGNPHIVAASKRDYSIPTPQTRVTFPEPLPLYLPRTAKVPTTTIPETDPNSANAGRFSLSLKGMRRELRRSGFRAELLVRDVEFQIVEWLQEGGIILNPDSREADDLTAIGVPIGNTGTIFEVSRTPLQLVWSINNDSFARYVVHCCARYHEIVSFSKEISQRRLTYLLRPNVIRPDHYAVAALDTPPVTDLDYSSYADTESDRGGLETESDTEQFPVGQASHLSVITEDHSLPSSPRRSPRRLDEDQWSVVGDTDMEGDESESDAEPDFGAATLDPIPPNLNEVDFYLRQKATLRHGDSPRERANSSPSRSPVRRPFRRMPLRLEQPRFPRPPPHRQRSFYEYLFS